MGLLIEMAAATGSRASQLKRITVRDLQTGAEARVMIPVSDKGPGKKAIRERPIPILPSPAIKLQRSTEGRRPGDWLLVDEEGGQWRKKAENHPFKAITKRLSILDDAGQPVTMYALRHYSITRQLLNGVPESIVADAHDTSPEEIRKTYAKYIVNRADAQIRAAQIDFGPGLKVTA
jgi:integrase